MDLTSRVHKMKNEKDNVFSINHKSIVAKDKKSLITKIQSVIESAIGDIEDLSKDQFIAKKVNLDLRKIYSFLQTYKKNSKG